jgi:hypothetical protein
VSAPRDRAHARLFAARLVTGPLAHLLGGVLDVGQALCAHALARTRARVAGGRPATRARELLGRR